MKIYRTINSGQDILSNSELFLDTEGLFHPISNQEMTLDDLKSIYEEYEARDDEAIHDFDSFDSWLSELVETKQLKPVVKSSCITSTEKISKRKKVTSSTQYTDYSTITVANQKFGVHSKHKDDPYNFQCSIQEIHPYDDAEYYWIKKDAPNSASVILNGKIQDYITLADWDDCYDEYEGESQEFIEDIIVSLCEELMIINENIEPRMMHN